MRYSRPELLDRLASEYVLGTLRGRAKRRFERVLAETPAARAAVRDWQDRLAPLAQSIAAVPPPARVWQAIELRTAPARRELGGWRSWLKPLTGFALGALLTAGIVLMAPERFVSLDGLAQREQALPQSYVGLLTNAQGEPVVLASSTRHGTRMSIKFLRPVDLPAGKILQLWAMPRDAAPFALGRFGTAKPPGKVEFELAASSEKLLSNVPRLVVTVEDAAAAAPSAPTTEILSGHCVKLW
jgi:anti-sigma-K factor RskA